MKNYSYIDLFCGPGGLSIGFGDQCYDLKLANDIDANAVNTFKYNLKTTHPEISDGKVIHGDIKELYKYLGTDEVKEHSDSVISVQTQREKNQRNKTANLSEDKNIKNILSQIKNVDVLAGGPPCQGFSMIGRSKRATIEERAQGFVDDPRNQLFKYFLKFAESTNPKIILIENVKGLASASRYRDLIEESVSTTGRSYVVKSEILNAKNFGIAQHRERIFFIGIRKDLSEKYNLNPDDIFQALNDIEEDSLVLKDVISDLPKLKSNPLPNNYKEESEITIGKQNSFGQNISSTDYHELITDDDDNYINKINKYRTKNINPSKLYNHKSRYHNERDLFIYKHLVQGKYLNDPANLKAMSKVTYGVNFDKNGKKRIKGFEDKYFKLDYEKVSKTIISHLETDGNSYVHPGPNPRSITPREAARIQSFPDWYFFTGSTRNQFSQIGNAVPPILAKIIASEIKKVLDKIS